MSRWLIDKEEDRACADYEQISAAELEVFELRPELAEDLHDGFSRYMDFLDLVSPPEDGPRADADRKAYPQFAPTRSEAGKVIYSNYDAAKFMQTVCGLPYDQAYRFNVKIEMAQCRMGIIELP